jgi:hypothetical protein
MRIAENTYQNLLSPDNLALLSDWLAEASELVVYVDRPHSGGSHDQFLIESLADLKAVLAAETWPELRLTVFRGKQYPTRGLVEESFINMALREIPDGKAYSIVRIGRFPRPYEYYDEGRSHAELRLQLERLWGAEVAVGQNPLAQGEVVNGPAHERRFEISITKNQNFYKPFSDNPGHYEGILATWYSS